jgi:tetratricopeptide (TPR) repeat protein
MFTFLKRPLYVLSNKLHRRRSSEGDFKASMPGGIPPGNIPEEKWIADFSRLEQFPFDIKPENSYDAYPAGNLAVSEGGPRIPGGNSLGLALKKTDHLAWVETPERYYGDQVIEARFRLDSMGGYAATGLLFRLVDDDTYYIALVSSKGYFRLDAMKNGAALPLVGWTETPVLDEQRAEDARQDSGDSPLAIRFTIIACGEHLIFLINDRWIAETSDQSSAAGRIGFVLASYEAGTGGGEAAPVLPGHVCRAWLDYLAVDSRRKTVEGLHRKWSESALIPAESRFRLAETFAAMGAAAAALAQITTMWEQREAAARSVTATYTEMRRRRELLLAARMARRLERLDDAEEYIDACLEQGWDNPEGAAAITEKNNILVMQKKYSALKAFTLEQIARKAEDPALYALLGHAHWNLKEYENAAAVWDRAFELDRENGFYAINAANAYVLLGKNDEALRRCLEGGRIFLRKDNTEELGALIPRLLSLGEQNWEARALTGKWAFGGGDFDRAESELVLAENLRRKLRPQPPADPAVSYLRAMLLAGKGKRREAIRLLEEAVRLAPEYGLFRFKLAENRYLLSGSVRAPGLAADLKAALSLMPDDGWVHNFAARFCLARNSARARDLDAAGQYLQKAAAILGDIPEVKVNRAVLLSLRGSPDKALKMLEAEKDPSPEMLGLINRLKSRKRPAKLPAAPKGQAASPPKTAKSGAAAVSAKTKPGNKVDAAPAERKRGQPQKSAAPETGKAAAQLTRGPGRPRKDSPRA